MIIAQYVNSIGFQNVYAFYKHANDDKKFLKFWVFGVIYAK